MQSYKTVLWYGVETGAPPQKFFFNFQVKNAECHVLVLRKPILLARNLDRGINRLPGGR